MKKLIQKLRTKKGLVTAGAICLVAGNASAEADTAALADVVTDCLAWLAYGTTTYITLMGAALTIVAGTWVYRKIKGALRVA